MRQPIYLVVFLSGFAALVFETLWFRQAGLAFGNSIWSATLVLGSFMGGLALGNGLVLRFGARLVRPIRAYAALEVLVAGTGLLVVLALPAAGVWLAPALRPLLDAPAMLNVVRLTTAFAVLVVPATAMGATLPVLVRALARRDRNFGRVLGRLYGWNTLGATVGVLAAELWLVRWLGILGSAVVALLFGAAAAALALRHRSSLDRDADAAGPGVRLDHRGLRYLIAAGTAGMAMLGLEVLWFRFLLLFQPGTSLVFAVMLATVLCGVALGGIVAARLYAIDLRVHRSIRLVAGSSALLIAASYALFPHIQPVLLDEFGAAGFQGGFIAAAVFLMLPVSLASGVIFTALGRGLRDVAGDGLRTTAWITLANTLGAMLGSLLAGFVLLPVLGTEQSFALMIGVYALLALVAPQAETGSRRAKLAASWLPVAAFLLSLAVFPFGLMEGTFLGRSITERFPGTRTVAAREGLTETALYLEYEKFGQPYFYRLLTNSYSMSTTSEQSMRYMKLFAYLPVAVRPGPGNALLISFGIGNTAEALVDTAGLESIDIVDISRDILELSEIVFPDPANHPLNDDRVSVHIEDGRFFLQVTDKRYDLITAEPPPPTIAGVVNLYTREFFALIRSRLTQGGVASYWLPGHALEEDAAKAIVRAFCSVFDDCSLWGGAGLDWILLGSRDATGRVDFAAFARQWHDAHVADELRAIGVENPQQLGALFMADARELRQATAGVRPVVDNFPYRIMLPYSGNRDVPPFYAWLMDTDRAARSFANSEFVRRLWPRELVADTLPYFAWQALINQRYAPGIGRMPPHPTQALQRLLVDTDLETLPLWLLGSSYYEQRLLDSVADDPAYAEARELGWARRAIAERRFGDAVRHLDRLREVTGPANPAGVDRLYRLVAALEINRADRN